MEWHGHQGGQHCHPEDGPGPGGDPGDAGIRRAAHSRPCPTAYYPLDTRGRGTYPNPGSYACTHANSHANTHPNTRVYSYADPTTRVYCYTNLDATTGVYCYTNTGTDAYAHAHALSNPHASTHSDAYADPHRALNHHNDYGF